MDKRRIIYMHVFVWLFAVFANLSYSGMMKGMAAIQIGTNIIAFFYLMIVFYLFYLAIAPLFLNRKKLANFFAVSFLVVLVLPFFGYTLLFLSRALFEGSFRQFYKGYSLAMHMSGYVPVLIAAVFGSFFRVIINWFTTMNQKAESDRQRLAAELELLKGKFNPHFLFNTLNNIDSLIPQDPEGASAALIRLSDIMRYLTYETVTDTVELVKEAGYIRNLMELYRLRVKAPEKIRFEVSGDMDQPVAPALFLPLVENAFKFASFKNNDLCVEMFLSSNNGMVTFESTNFYDAHATAVIKHHSGTGLKNLRKRLELIYPDKHQLKTSQDGLQYKAILIVNTHVD